MGLILDSSVVIAAERRNATPADLVRQITSLTGDQEAAVSAVGLVELVHGICRAGDPRIRQRREAFIHQLISALPVYPFTRDIAFVAGRVDGAQQAQGIRVPYQDLLIGATALHLRYSVVTLNPRHFHMIPGLKVIAL